MNNGMWPSGQGPTGASSVLIPELSETSPPELTGNVDDYLPVGLRIARRLILRLSSDASRTITGLRVRKLLPLQEVVVINVGVNAIVLAHNDSGSQEPNRFLSPITVLGLGVDFTLGPRTAMVLLYDVLVQKWRVISFALDLL